MEECPSVNLNLKVIIMHNLNVVEEIKIVKKPTVMSVDGKQSITDWLAAEEARINSEKKSVKNVVAFVKSFF